MRENILNKKFNRLLVIEVDPIRATDGKIKYICKCDCGNTTSIAGTMLRNGRAKSCGCLRKEMAAMSCIKRTKEKNKVDLTGKIFGLLKVTQRINGNGVNTIWECECQCGKTKRVIQSSLVNGLTNSCGCKERGDSSGRIKTSLGIIDGTSVSRITSNNLSKNNTSGHRGVNFHSGKWRSYIGFKKKLYYLGSYDNLEDAIKVRKIAEEKMYGEFIKWYEEYKKINSKTFQV